MTTCHGCNRPLEPLAAIRTYHAECDPKGRVEMLERALGELSSALIGARNIFDSFDEKVKASERLNNAEKAARAALEHKPSDADAAAGEGEGLRESE